VNLGEKHEVQKDITHTADAREKKEEKKEEDIHQFSLGFGLIGEFLPAGRI
jgi:hypothetical protein